MGEVWIRPNAYRAGNGRGKVPFVSLSNKEKSTMYFNTKLMQDLLNDNKYVKIGIDNIKKRMYIKQTTFNDIHSIKLNKNTNNKGAVITKMSLVNKLINVAGINVGDIQRYQVHKENGNLYYVNFNKPMSSMKGEIINDWQ